jgi:hypothetical protein
MIAPNIKIINKPNDYLISGIYTIDYKVYMYKSLENTKHFTIFDKSEIDDKIVIFNQIRGFNEKYLNQILSKIKKIDKFLKFDRIEIQIIKKIGSEIIE